MLQNTFTLDNFVVDKVLCGLTQSFKTSGGGEKQRLLIPWLGKICTVWNRALLKPRP